MNFYKLTEKTNRNRHSEKLYEKGCLGTGYLTAIHTSEGGRVFKDQDQFGNGNGHDQQKVW